MLRLGRTALRCLLVIALIAGLVPLYAPATPADAATEHSVFKFTDFSTDIASPTYVNTNTVTLRGTFTGIGEKTIYYEIDRITADRPNVSIESSRSAALPVIMNGSTFIFSNVNLFEGLNRITVKGVNSEGNVIPHYAYVYFNNVAFINSVKIGDGRTLVDGEPAIVETGRPVFTVLAENANEVTINGKVMFQAAAGTFLLNDLQLTGGRNVLSIVARNDNGTSSISRQLVYFNQSPTVYEVLVKKSGAPNVRLEGNPTVEPLDGQIHGKIIFLKPSAEFGAYALTFSGSELIKTSGGTGGYQQAVNVTVQGSPTESERYLEYSFVSSAIGNPALTNGEYLLTLKGFTNTGTFSYPIAFSVRDANSPYIEGITQLHGVPAGSSGQAPYTQVNFSSETEFSDNTIMYQLPIWLALDMSPNYIAANATVELVASVGGVQLDPSNAAFKAVRYNTPDGRPVFFIENMPSGSVKLSFKVTHNSGNSNTLEQFVQYTPIPSIQVDTYHNGAVLYSEQVFQNTEIKGRLINFNLATDLSAVKVSMNGVTIPLLQATNIQISGNEFRFLPANLPLVYGSNELVFSGNVGGVAVTTRITILRFSADSPAVVFNTPVATTLAPGNDPLATRQFIDIDGRFTYLGPKQYETLEKHADFVFGIREADQAVIRQNGQEIAIVEFQGGNPVITKGGPPTVGDLSQQILYVETAPENMPGVTRFRLYNISLANGENSITIELSRNITKATDTVTVNRITPAYRVLSPMLPQERVVNQNFLNVSIQAEGADRVELGSKKLEMHKGAEDIFRLELKDELKPGRANTIRFSVYRGTQKVDGSFTVNYAGDNAVGSQYKSTIPNSGRLSVFKGELTVSFPKNTFLRKKNLFPGQYNDQFGMFDSQEILFGIANPEDGRTVTVYNQVGETDSTDGRPLDGNFSMVVPTTSARSEIAAAPHFGFASNLFWIDAGYITGSLPVQGEYEYKSGMQPYSQGDVFTERGADKWLEPTQRGTITIQYDPALRNVASNTLGIWWLDASENSILNNGQKWKQLGGIVDTGKKTVTAPFEGFGYYVVMNVRYSFYDIINHGFARNSLELMMGKGLMKSKNANEFGVYDNITRGEFAQLLVKLLEIPLQYDPNNLTFDDVIPLQIPGELWDYRYIETAARTGIVRGIGPRLFLPTGSLTREEAAVMIARATNLLKGNEDNDKDRVALQKVFTDANVVGTYAVSAVLAINKAGYIEGMPNALNEGEKKPTYSYSPGTNLTRAQAAIIAERVMRKLKKL